VAVAEREVKGIGGRGGGQHGEEREGEVERRSRGDRGSHSHGDGAAVSQWGVCFTSVGWMRGAAARVAE
jgi:hypothetical protein